jgi:hypothetical protein
MRVLTASAILSRDVTGCFSELPGVPGVIAIQM